VPAVRPCQCTRPVGSAFLMTVRAMSTVVVTVISLSVVVMQTNTHSDHLRLEETPQFGGVLVPVGRTHEQKHSHSPREAVLAIQSNDNSFAAAE
jgi:hypothetical protein